MKLQVGVKVLLTNEKNEYLFLRRSAEGGHGLGNVWDVPGGRIYPEEPLLDALKREVMEETGLVLENKLTLLAAQDIFATKKDLHVVRLTYRGKANGDVRLSDEHDNFSWLDKKILSTSDYKIDPYLLEVL